MSKDPVLVGRFGAAHGIKGEVRLKSFTSNPHAIANYGPLFNASGTRQFTIESLRHLRDDLFVVKIAGIHDRASAEALTNIELFVPHAALPEIAADEFYCTDLIGLVAQGPEGHPVGRVIDVLDFGGGDILEIARSDGGETLLLPFTKAVVPVIDLTAGTLTIVRPIEIEGEAGASPDQLVPLHQRKTQMPGKA